MVKIALAGGAGDVGSEIIEVLLATKKHEIIVLSRSSKPKRALPDGVTLIAVDYSDLHALIDALRDVNTLLSFVSEGEDPTSPIQRNLIDAAILAGVKRFAPSEWASSKMDHLDWYAYKGATREYLKEVNKDKQVLEYCLFQPGLFSNYLSYPYPSTKYLHLMDLPLNFNDRRFITLAGGDSSRINFVTVQDLTQIVAKAIDYSGSWPVDGGIYGSEISIRDLISLAEKIREDKVGVTELQREDIAAGEWKAGWAPMLDHPAIKKEDLESMSKHITGRMLLAWEAGSYVVNREWNNIFPDYKFETLEDFLTKVWDGKP